MESGEKGHYIRLDNDVLWRRHNAGGCTHSWGLYMVSLLFCMHLGFFEPPDGFTAPQVEAPSDYRVCSIQSFALVEHCSFLIGLPCSYPSVA